MDNKVDNSGSGKVDKLLFAADALTKQVSSLKSELRKIKMKKGVTNIIAEVNIFVEVVLAITRSIITIVIIIGKLI